MGVTCVCMCMSFTQNVMQHRKVKEPPHQQQPAQQNRDGVTLQEIHLMQNYMFQQWEHFKTFGCGLIYALMRSKEKTLCFCFGFFFQPLTLILTAAKLILDMQDFYVKWFNVFKKKINSSHSPRITSL